MTTAVRFIQISEVDLISEVHLCLGEMTRSVRFTCVYNGRHDQISEGHLCLQWETWPDQWGSPVSTMGDMTRSVRVTCVYNGRHDQITEGHLCLQWETWPDQWGSPVSTMGDMTRSVRVTYVYNGRHDQISEGHLCLQWETWPDQWGSPMSTMGDMTRSVRVTYVYNGRHDQISEGHLCIIGRQKQWSSQVHRGSQTMTRWVRFASLQRQIDPTREVHLSREGDRLTKAMRFTSTHRESEAHPTNQMHGEAHQYWPLFYSVDEVVKLIEGGARTPQAQSGHVGHVLGLRGTGGTGVDHPCLGQAVLQLHHGHASFGRFAGSRGAQVLGLVALVKHNLSQLRTKTKSTELYKMTDYNQMF